MPLSLLFLAPYKQKRKQWKEKKVFFVTPFVLTTKIFFFLLSFGIIIQLHENVSKKHIQKISKLVLLIVYQLNKAVAWIQDQ